jgi:hypothetical protein
MLILKFQTGPWYKRFPEMIVCGELALIKTFLRVGQVPAGKKCLSSFSQDATTSTRGRARYPDGIATRGALLFHPVEGFLQQREVARMAEFLARGIYPFLFQGVFRWAITLIEHAEHSRKR